MDVNTCVSKSTLKERLEKADNKIAVSLYTRKINTEDGTRAKGQYWHKLAQGHVHISLPWIHSDQYWSFITITETRHQGIPNLKEQRQKNVNFFNWSLTGFWRGLWMFPHKKAAWELIVEDIPSSPMLFLMSLPWWYLENKATKKWTHWSLGTKNIWNLQALKSTPLAGEWVSVVWTDMLMEIFWFHTSLKCSSQEIMEQICLNNDWLTNLNMQHLMRITYQSQVSDFRALPSEEKKALLAFRKRILPIHLLKLRQRKDFVQI